MWSATGTAVLWTLVFMMVESRTSLDINPGLAVAIRNYGRPNHTPFLLHPSLTSAKYLEAKASSRKAKQTDFIKLKEQLISDAEDDNVAVETNSAPYARLPQSYLSLFPASYYATHTFVPPIKDLYTHDANAGSVKTAVSQAPEVSESSRTSDKGDLSSSSNQVNSDADIGDDEEAANQLYPGEIIVASEVVAEKSQGGNEHVDFDIAPSYDDKSSIDEEEASAEYEADFKPSGRVPVVAPSSASFFQPQSELLSTSSSFGVAVTPITVGADGLKASKSSSSINNVDFRPRVKINRPPNLSGNSLPTLQGPFLANASKKKKPPFAAIDQLASAGYYQNQVASRPASDAPANNALLYLAPSGPSMPVFSKLRQDFGHMMKSFSHGPLRQMSEDLNEARGQPIMSRVSNTISKVFGGQIGDRSFDGFDYVPLIVVLVVSGLVLSLLFPSGLNTLGINQGSLVIGRRGGRAEDETMLDQALGHLETGVMMVSALRYEDGCSARLACRLGQMAKSSDWIATPTVEAVFQGLHGILPDKYNSFARSFRAVANNEDDSSCQEECYRCIAI